MPRGCLSSCHLSETAQHEQNWKTLQLKHMELFVLFRLYPHDQIPEVLARAHVGVLPFPDEEKFRVSSPIKLFEYMAAGTADSGNAYCLPHRCSGQRGICVLGRRRRRAGFTRCFAPGLAVARLAERDGATSSHRCGRVDMDSVCGKTEEGPGEGIPISTITNGDLPGMNETNHKVGYFVFSLDTELAWGSLWDQPRSERTSRDGSKERETIRRLLDMMDEFGIVATWAITGHLFYEKCEECEVCPILGFERKRQPVRTNMEYPRPNVVWG